MTNVQRETTTGAEPITADELMAWARITDPQERPTLERLIKVAREEVERFTGYVLTAGVFVVTTTWAARVALPLTPITAIAAVSSIDAYGYQTALDADAYAALLTVAPAVLVVYAYGYEVAALEVSLTAGFDDVAEIPEELRQAVFDVALLHYTHRDDPDLLSRVRAYLGTVSTQLGIVQV